ncbi:MAG: 2-oxoacid:acceptor oxidoreductase family protein [Actinomycetes bacterium]
MTDFEIRIHGRGGQGVVSAAEMLALAAFEEGRHAQAFPTFGSERTGSPVISFCRIADEPIRIHDPITRPDALIVQDPTLIHQVRLFEGVRPDGFVLVNTARSFVELGLGRLEEGLDPHRVRCIPATELARAELGRPLPNTALLGAFAAMSGIVRLSSLDAAIRQTFPEPLAVRNIAAAHAAHDLVCAQSGQVSRA